MTQTTMFNPVLYRMIIPLVVILLTMLGYKAPFFYALALFIVAPTVLAILANRWEQQDIAFRETSLDIVYTQYNWIHVPVEDERVYLSNIFFSAAIDPGAEATHGGADQDGCVCHGCLGSPER